MPVFVVRPHAPNRDARTVTVRYEYMFRATRNIYKYNIHIFYACLFCLSVYMFTGGLNIPSAMLGIMAGGVILRKMGLTVRSSAAMCTVAVFVSIMFAIPLLYIGCPTQSVSGVNYNE